MAGDFNPLTLQQIEKYINDVTPRNPFGRRISQRVPQKVERGVYGGKTTNAIDLLFSRISESAVPATRRFSEEGRRAIEERKKEALKGWAIATGNWHTDLSEFTNDKEPFVKGTDSKVYTSKDGSYVIKASKGKPYGKRFRADIDNVALFNHIFPNSKYDILGYGEIDGNFVRILRQPVVDFSENASLSEDERVTYMAELGFKPLNKEDTAFSNGDFVAADLQKANIVKDAMGNISIIDADMKLHTTDIGGNYSYAPVEEDVLDDGVLYRSSEELTAEYGDRWLTEQTNSDGRHTTQVKNTLRSYEKFGEWVERDSNGREVSVLDASSGLGLGTEHLRNMGMDVEDVEPYPSADRAIPTYSSYDEIDKKYDYIISNAVLNVIPDDWRDDLLHNMADKLNVGGKLVINVRSAESIKKQGIEGKTRITLDDPSEILVLRPDGSIKAYQKGFTKQELKSWCEKELGEGYSVEIANNNNAGGSYDTAVVITKNNESPAKSKAYELGLPTNNGATVAKFDTKVGKNIERINRLRRLSEKIYNSGGLGSHQLLHEINIAFDTDLSTEQSKTASFDKSRYYDLGRNTTIRISDHQGNADTFARRNNTGDNYGIVIKLSPSLFKHKENVDYLEYVYFHDHIAEAKRQLEVVDGIRTFIETGDFSKLPMLDRVNPSGKFKEMADSVAERSGEGAVSDEGVTMASDPVSKAIGELRYGLINKRKRMFLNF